MRRYRETARSGPRRQARFTTTGADATRATACLNDGGAAKARYVERREARDAARRATDDGRPMRVYLCPTCIGYHLTSDRR